MLIIIFKIYRNLVKIKSIIFKNNAIFFDSHSYIHIFITLFYNLNSFFQTFHIFYLKLSSKMY